MFVSLNFMFFVHSPRRGEAEAEAEARRRRGGGEAEARRRRLDAAAPARAGGRRLARRLARAVDACRPGQDGLGTESAKF